MFCPEAGKPEENGGPLLRPGPPDGIIRKKGETPREAVAAAPQKGRSVCRTTEIGRASCRERVLEGV